MKKAHGVLWRSLDLLNGASEDSEGPMLEYLSEVLLLAVMILVVWYLVIWVQEWQEGRASENKR